MIDDPVYQDFISPDLRAERVRAERAEQEAQEKQEQLDQINAYLKTQGISLPDELKNFG